MYTPFSLLLWDLAQSQGCFLAMKSLVLFSERLFYQPPWLFFPPAPPSPLPSSSVSEGLRRTPQNPPISHGPFLLLSPPLLFFSWRERLHACVYR